MKNILAVSAAIIVLTFTSCYVGVEGRHHHHRVTRVEIRADNNGAPADSLKSPAMSSVDKQDSTKIQTDPAIRKQ